MNIPYYRFLEVGLFSFLNLVPFLLEKFQHGLRIILVDLAPQRVEGHRCCLIQYTFSFTIRRSEDLIRLAFGDPPSP